MAKILDVVELWSCIACSREARVCVFGHAPQADFYGHREIYRAGWRAAFVVNFEHRCPEHARRKKSFRREWRAFMRIAKRERIRRVRQMRIWKQEGTWT